MNLSEIADHAGPMTREEIASAIRSKLELVECDVEMLEDRRRGRRLGPWEFEPMEPAEILSDITAKLDSLRKYIYELESRLAD